MLIGVNSEDIRLCSQLAVMCNENNFKIVFIDENDDLIDNINYAVIDLDFNIEMAMDKCKKYNEVNCMVFGVLTTPTKSIILKAKKAGCVIVLTRPNFSANLF